MISKFLRQARQAKQLTQAELASKSGLSVGTIQNYESGQSSPNERNLKRLADALGISVDSLRTGEGLDALKPDPKQEVEPILKAFLELTKLEDTPIAVPKTAALSTMINPVVGPVVFGGSLIAQSLIKAKATSNNKKELLDMLFEAYSNCSRDIKNCRSKLQNLADRIDRIDRDYWNGGGEVIKDTLVSLLLMYQNYLFSIMDKSTLYRRCINALSHKDMKSFEDIIDLIKKSIPDERIIESKIKRQEEELSKQEELVMKYYE